MKSLPGIDRKEPLDGCFESKEVRVATSIEELLEIRKVVPTVTQWGERRLNRKSSERAREGIEVNMNFGREFQIREYWKSISKRIRYIVHGLISIDVFA